MLRNTLIALVALAWLFPEIAAADSLKVGVVDVEALRERSPARARLQRKYDKMYAAERAKLDRVQKRLKAMQKDLEKHTSLKPAVLKKKRDELKEERKAVEKALREAQDRANALMASLYEELTNQAESAIESVAKKGGFDLIVKKSSVVWSKHDRSPTDLTKRVMAKMR